MREMTEAERMTIPEAHRPDRGTKFQRSQVVEIDMPPAKRTANYVDVLFDAVEPIPTVAAVASNPAQVMSQQRESILEL
jgi:hypothetical protein